MLIRDLNPDERPMERLIRHGPANLSDSELLSIIFGGQTSLQASRKLLADGLVRLANTPRLADLAPARQAKMKAFIELARRFNIAELPHPEQASPEGLGRRLVIAYRDLHQEHFGAVYLDSRNRVLTEKLLFIGTLHSTSVSPREVLKHALLENAASFIVHHNHPSGDPTPSRDDVAFTANLKQVSKALGFELTDHLVLGRNRYVSMLQQGLF